MTAETTDPQWTADGLHVLYTPIPPMKTQLSQSRRQFLQRTAAAGAGLLLTPLAMSAARSRSASERITVGMIGIGAMGRGHLDRLLGFEDVQVVAVCDVEKTRRETARAQVEKLRFYLVSPPSMVRNSQRTKYLHLERN